MAQLRSGILPIRIETGPFCKLPVEERLCEMCNQGKVEDEFHFIMECPLYHQERQGMFEKTDIDGGAGGDRENFQLLFKTHWREVGAYLTAAWAKRRSTLFR